VRPGLSRQGCQAKAVWPGLLGQGQGCWFNDKIVRDSPWLLGQGQGEVQRSDEAKGWPTPFGKVGGLKEL
jgi:hypothetical protein